LARLGDQHADVAADAGRHGRHCGAILTGEEAVQQVGGRSFQLMLATASGLRTKSESFDFGAAEFAPWVIGATM